MSAPLSCPPYGSGTLADVLPSVASMWSVPGYSDTLGLRGRDPGSDAPDAVTVLLVDGLGWWPWQGESDRTPGLSAMGAARLSTTVPSTTPTALASLGTGTPPGAHGILGASFRLPEDDVLLHPLSWAEAPHPVATQPEPTVFERAAAAGVPVLRIGASAYAGSGLTRAVLRGGEYANADDQAAIVDAIAGHRRGMAYAYVTDLDRTGHVHGIDSPEWRAGLRTIDELVVRILERLDERHLLLVTADHGMVDCPVGSRISVEALPGFDRVTAVAGEPRLRHVYTLPGAAAALRDAWQESLGDRARVLERDEVIALGAFGAMDEHYADRVGDLVAIAEGGTLLVSDVDPLVSGLVGQHGALTPAEMDIPLLLARGCSGG